jgi:phage gpG-like protein
VTLELTGANELTIWFDAMGDNIIPAAAAAMGETVTFLQAIVVDEKLSGQALNVRSGDLQNSIITSVDSVSTEVVGTVGVDPSSPAARYGAVHEFGGTFEIPEHLSHSSLGKEFTVRSHSATFEEHSFLRSALTENKDALAQLFTEKFLQAVAA